MMRLEGIHAVDEISQNPWGYNLNRGYITENENVKISPPTHLEKWNFQTCSRQRKLEIVDLY